MYLTACTGPKNMIKFLSGKSSPITLLMALQKKGTPARGAKWNAVMNQLLQIREPSFKVSLVNINRTATAMVKRALKVKKISREDRWLCTCL